MNKRRLKISVYWDNKQATLRACTHAMLNFLCKLKAYQPSFFGTWYGGGRSIKEALSNKISLTYECIKNHLSKRDKDDSYSDVGYGGDIWNGQDIPKSMSISIAQGEGGIGGNSCKISLPEAGDIYDYFKAPAHQLALTKLMIAHWKPSLIWIHDYTKKITPPFTDEKLLQAINDNVIYF